MTTIEEINSFIKKRWTEMNEKALQAQLHDTNPLTKEETEHLLERILASGEYGFHSADFKQRNFIEWFMRNQTGMEYKMEHTPTYGVVIHPRKHE
jgi:hypothetical protein